MRPSLVPGVLLALALVLPGSTTGSRADAGVAAPFAAMRALQAAQEQIAHGSAAAQAEQPKLMARVAEAFQAASPEVWRDGRNARAAVLFLLSGGQSSVVRAVLAKAALPHEFDDLLKGALAYGEGDDATARDVLGRIDPRGLPSTLGGHLALVQAMLLSGGEDAKAVKLLDLARLLVPGTLVEEAALRRQIFLLAGPETFDKFVFLSRDYIRRFRGSVYASNFKQRLTAVATKLAMAGDTAALGKFDTILVELPVKERLAFQLAIAKVAIVQGKAGAARDAAAKAGALVPDSSEDGARSKLYAGAAEIVSETSGEGLRTLESIDRHRLSAEDADLRDAAIAVATSVRADVAREGGAAGTGPLDAATAGGPPDSDVIARARGAVAETDRLLAGTRR